MDLKRDESEKNYQSKEELSITVTKGRKKRGKNKVLAKNLEFEGIRYVYLRKKTVFNGHVIIEYKCQIKNNNRKKGFLCNAVIKEREHDGYCLICGSHDKRCLDEQFFEELDESSFKSQDSTPSPNFSSASSDEVEETETIKRRKRRKKIKKERSRSPPKIFVPPPPPPPPHNQMGGQNYGLPIQLVPQLLIPQRHRHGGQFMDQNTFIKIEGQSTSTAPRLRRRRRRNSIKSRNNNNQQFHYNQQKSCRRGPPRPISPSVLERFMIIGAQPTYIQQLGVTTSKIYLNFPNGVIPPQDIKQVTIRLRDKLGKVETIPQNANCIPFMRFQDNFIGDQWAFFAANSEILITFPLQFSLYGLLDLHVQIVSGQGRILEDLKCGVFVVEKGFNSSESEIPSKKRKRGEIGVYTGVERVYGALPNVGSTKGGDYVELYFSTSLENVYVMNREQDFCVTFGDSRAQIVCIKIRDSSLRSRYAEDYKSEYEECGGAEYMALVISPPHSPGYVNIGISSKRSSKTIIKEHAYLYADKKRRSMDLYQSPLKSNLEEEEEEPFGDGLFEDVRTNVGGNSKLFLDDDDDDGFSEIHFDDDDIDGGGFYTITPEHSTDEEEEEGEEEICSGIRDHHIFSFMKKKELVVSSISSELLKNNQLDFMGWDILFHAVANGLSVLVKELVDLYRFNPSRKDYFGNSALEVARIFHFEEIERFLKMSENVMIPKKVKEVFCKTIKVKYSKKKKGINWKKIKRGGVSVEIRIGRKKEESQQQQQHSSSSYEFVVVDTIIKKIFFMRLGKGTVLQKVNYKKNSFSLINLGRNLSLKFEFKEDFNTFRSHIQSILNQDFEKTKEEEDDNDKKKSTTFFFDDISEQQQPSSNLFKKKCVSVLISQWKFKHLEEFLECSFGHFCGKNESLYIEMKSRKLLKPLKRILSKKNVVVDLYDKILRNDEEISLLFNNNNNEQHQDILDELTRHIHLLLISKKNDDVFNPSYFFAQMKFLKNKLENKNKLRRRRKGSGGSRNTIVTPIKGSQLLLSSEETLRIEHQEYWDSEFLELKMLSLLLFKKDLKGVCEMMEKKLEKLYHHNFDSFSRFEKFRIENISYTYWFRKNEKNIKQLYELEKIEREWRDQIINRRSRSKNITEMEKLRIKFLKKKIKNNIMKKKEIGDSLGIDYRLLKNNAEKKVDICRFLDFFFHSRRIYRTELQKMMSEKLKQLELGVNCFGKSRIRYPLEYVVSGRYDDKGNDTFHSIRMNNMMIVLSKRNEGFVEICDFHQTHKNLEEICCVDTKSPLFIGYDNLEEVISGFARYITNEWNLKKMSKKLSRESYTTQQMKFCQDLLKKVEGWNMFEGTELFINSLAGENKKQLVFSNNHRSRHLFTRKIKLLLEEKPKNNNKKKMIVEDKDFIKVFDIFIDQIGRDEIMDDNVKIKVLNEYKNNKEVIIPNKRCLDILRKSIPNNKLFDLRYPEAKQLLDSFHSAFESFWDRNGVIQTCIHED